MGWCVRRNLDPVGADVVHILNFLASLASEGLAYRTINTFRSPISAGHSVVADHPVGDHPLVKKLLRGIQLSFPPEPRYSVLWDVNKVLCLLADWPTNKYLSRKQLSSKLAMLLCLVSCRRVSDVRALDISGRSFTPDGVTFQVSRRTKTQSRVISYPSFPDCPQLCVVRCIRAYKTMTEEVRPHGKRQLLIALRKPF